VWHDSKTGGQKPTIAIMTASMGMLQPGDTPELHVPMVIQVKDGVGTLRPTRQSADRLIQAPTYKVMRNELIL
jgi:hypothetical protein